MINSEAATKQSIIVTENNNNNNIRNTNTNITTTTTNSNLSLSNKGEGSDGSENDDKNEECGKDIVVPLPASLLLQAAKNNPCATCFEDFLPSDTVLFCSNHLVVIANNKNKNILLIVSMKHVPWSICSSTPQVSTHCVPCVENTSCAP